MNSKILSLFPLLSLLFLSCSGAHDDPSDPIQSMYFPDPGIYGVWISGPMNKYPQGAFIPTLLGPDNFKKYNGTSDMKFDADHFQILRIYAGQDSAGKSTVKYSYCRKSDDISQTTVSEGSGKVFVLSTTGLLTPMISRTAFSENEPLNAYWVPVSSDQKQKHLLIYNAGNTNTLADCVSSDGNCDMAVLSGGAGGIGNVFYRVNSHKTKSVIDGFLSPNPFYDGNGKFTIPSGCGSNL